MSTVTLFFSFALCATLTSTGQALPSFRQSLCNPPVKMHAPNHLENVDSCEPGNHSFYLVILLLLCCYYTLLKWLRGASPTKPSEQEQIPFDKETSRQKCLEEENILSKRKHELEGLSNGIENTSQGLVDDSSNRRDDIEDEIIMISDTDMRQELINEMAKTTSVYLNVYDFSSKNNCVYWAGLGVFHCGIEVHGVEYTFAEPRDPRSNGIFEVQPRQFPGFKFKKSMFIGTTRLDATQFREFMEIQRANYNGDTYHMLVKNCNHFCKDICYKLTGKKIPKWVNRLARIGSILTCVVDARAKTIQDDEMYKPYIIRRRAVRHNPMYQPCIDSEKRKPNSFSCALKDLLRKRRRR